jgi:hypothetical protein
MGLVLWLIRDANALVLVIIAGAVYLTVLILVGGLNQPDMSLVWRLIPLDRLRARFRPGVAGR